MASKKKNVERHLLHPRCTREVAGSRIIESENEGATETMLDSRSRRIGGDTPKVFMDRYSLKDASGQTVRVLSRASCGQSSTRHCRRGAGGRERTQWEKRFYEALSDFSSCRRRILAGLVLHQVTFYNCMPPGQEVLTAVVIDQFLNQIGDLVVTHRNRLGPVSAQV